MTLPFTLQQLRIIKALSFERNFTKAAERLYISQPCLSQQFKSLEKRLGISLITRKNNQLEFTEAGKIFLTYSERILALCEESCRALNELQHGERGDLRIGTSPTVGTYIIPRLLALFIETYPQIKLKVQISSTKNMIKNILNRKVDIAIIGGNVPQNLMKSLDIIRFVEDEFLLIVPKLHPFASQERKIINKKDLYSLNFITLPSSSMTQDHIDKVLRKNKIDTNRLNIVMQLDSLEAIKASVALGLGVAFVSLSIIEKELALKSLEIIDVQDLTIKRTLSIVTNSSYQKSKALEFFHKELISLKNENDLIFGQL